MEFSFDVREGSQEGLRSPNESRRRPGEKPMPPKLAAAGSDPASDRLRKAIERNRAKQARRDDDAPAPQRAPTQRPQASAQQTQPSEAMLRAQAQAQAQAARQRAAQARMAASTPNPGSAQRHGAPSQAQRTAAAPMGAAARMQSAAVNRGATTSRMAASSQEARPVAREAAKPTEGKKSFSIPGFGRKKAELEPMEDENLPVRTTRKAVANSENTEFLTALRKSPRKSPAAVGYSTAKRQVKTKKKGQKTEEMAISYLVKFAWVFTGFLLLRLVFSEGGVMDYYAGESLLNEKFEEYQMIQKDNKDLAFEIEKIRYDKNFQKKLVRDNLGFIAKDEYMILFPKNKVSSMR